MKINYDNNSIKFIKHYSLALGIYSERKRLIKNPKLKIKNYFQLILDYTFIIFLFIPLLFHVEENSFWIGLYAIAFASVGLLICIFIFTMIYNFNDFRKLKKGSLILDENYFTDIHDNGKRNIRSWDEVELIYLDQEVLIIFCEKNNFFLFENNKSISKEIVLNNKNIPFIENRKKVNNVLLILKYFIIFAIFFALSFLILLKNYEKLEKEMKEIKLCGAVMNESISSKGSYKKIEKNAKDYLKKYYQIKEEYQSITPLNFFENYPMKDPTNELVEMKDYFENFEYYQEKSLRLIIEIENLLKEETIKNIGNDLNFDEVDTNTMYEQLSFVLEDDISFNWNNEKNMINEKTIYLKKMLNVLFKEEADWIVNNHQILFNKESDYQEYFTNYELFKNNEKSVAK